MTTPSPAKPEGLRARKRRATENAIELSAVKLSLEKGVENVTVEEICEMADISRSTFFNYFAARDYAIVGRAIDVPEGGAAFELLNTSPDDLPRGLFRLMFAGMGHSKVNTEVARLRTQLITEQPTAARMLLSTFMENSYRLTGAATAWLTAHPEHARTDNPIREASLATSLVTGAIVIQMADWMQGTGDVDATEEDFEQVMREYLVFFK